MKQDMTHLKQEIVHLLDQAEETDAREHGQYGEHKRGDGHSQEFSPRESRLAKIDEATRALQEAAKRNENNKQPKLPSASTIPMAKLKTEHDAVSSKGGMARKLIKEKVKAIRASLRLAIAASLSGSRDLHDATEMEACIYKLDRLGDFVLSLGAIRLLLEAFGEERCLLIVSPFSSGLAALEFPRTPRVVMPVFIGFHPSQAVRRWFHRRKVLGRYSFKKLICLRHHRSLYDDVVLTWIRANKSYGASGAMLSAVPEDSAVFSSRFSSELKYPANAEPGFCRELEAHRQVCEATLGRKVDCDCVLPVIHDVGLPEGGVLLVSPFSSSNLKDYTLEKMVRAVSYVYHRRGTPIRVCVSRSDMNRGTRVVDLLRRDGAADSDLLVPESIPEYVKAVSAARILLTVDTATAQIATALDKPTVVIIGGGHYGFFGPWCRSGRQIWLTNHLDCFHCNWNCIYSEARCICDVHPDSISRALESLLSP